MLTYIKSNAQALVIALILAGLYYVFGFELERSDFSRLIGVYAALFILSYLLIRQFGYNFWLLAGIGIVLRLIFLPAIPNLSQDYFRFLWDGQIISQFANPYLITPDIYMDSDIICYDYGIAHSEELHNGMGNLNASHFSNYPPINQLLFGIAALLSGKSIIGSVIIIRLQLILADIGILLIGKKFLESLNLPARNIFLYFLNPLIIIECTGNLHYESAMLFFLVAAFYLLHKGKWFWAAVLFALSISTKLIPLIFLPLFYHYFVDKGLFSKGFWKLKKFFWVIIGVVVLTFLPFVSGEFLQNFGKTISLWFQDFEFNASVFYIIRWIGFEVNGWDPIQTVGKILPLVVVAFVLIMAFFRRNKNMKQLLTASLFVIGFYLLLATTVHPWYAATPLILSVFTKYRFVFVWSALVMLSYSAYTASGFDENLWLVAIQYSVVILFLLWELFFRRNMSESEIGPI